MFTMFFSYRIGSTIGLNLEQQKQCGEDGGGIFVEVGGEKMQLTSICHVCRINAGMGT